MEGLTKTLDIAGKGTIQWIINDDTGKAMIIKTEAYYVPSMSMQLLSPQAYFCHIQQGHVIVQPDHVQLHWSPEKVLTVPCDPIHNLPVVQATQKREQQQSITALATRDWMNKFKTGQQGLLKWSFCLGHIFPSVDYNSWQTNPIWVFCKK